MTDYTKRLYVDDEAEIGRLQSAIEQLTAKLAEAIRQRDEAEKAWGEDIELWRQKYDEARAALAQTVPQSVYESAVKGRQDFRDALRKARAELNECQPYLKERETVAECIARNRKDVVSVLEMLTKVRAELAEANKKLLSGAGRELSGTGRLIRQEWATDDAESELEAAKAENRALRKRQVLDSEVIEAWHRKLIAAEEKGVTYLRAELAAQAEVEGLKQQLSEALDAQAKMEAAYWGGAGGGK